MAKFTVDRRTWYRGSAYGSKLLRAEDGKRCCIGFVGQQCGISDVDLAGCADIKSIDSESIQGQFPRWMFLWAIVKAYTCNDDESISDELRETCLKEIFASNGDEIEFTN